MLKKRSYRLYAFFLVIFSVLSLASWLARPVSAQTLSNRSINLSTTIVSSISVTHTFSFTVASTSPIGSIVFQYCSNSPIVTVACTAPAGLNASATNLVNQSGNVGFLLHAPGTNANKITIRRTPAAALAVPSSYSFDNITNPSTPNATTYVRISTFITANGGGAITDTGSVAFSAVSPFAVDVIVPPFLRLCVAVTVATDCSSSTGNSLDLGILTPSATKFATSQFSTGTNSVTGYVVFVIGTTMTSGNNTITAIHPQGISLAGNSQFGINLKANTLPPVGEDPQGTGTGAPLAGYDIQNLFNLQSGDSIASSTLPSEYNKMTVSYIVNVNSSQAPGIYNTTMTYLATAEF